MTVNFNFIGKPGFLMEPSPLVVPQGSNAYFHCVVAGHPTPQVRWRDSRNSSRQVLIEVCYVNLHIAT